MLIVFMFFLHFIADFVLQTREMGKNKSSDPYYLSLHIFINFIVFAVGLSWYTNPLFGILFAMANSFLHFLIDISLWNIYSLTVWFRRKDKTMTKQQLKDNYEYWNDHLFYMTIGFDQFLHFASIIFIFMIFFK